MDKCTSVNSSSNSEHCEVDLDLGYIGPMSDKCASVLAKSDSKQTPGTSNYNCDCPETDCIVWSTSVAECYVTIFDGFVPDTGLVVYMGNFFGHLKHQTPLDAVLGC